MKKFASEFISNYSTYTFSYALYAQPESSMDLPEIYEQGYLPYSGGHTSLQNLFYLARSLRVDLSRFHDTSENRRVNRLALEHGITFSVIPKKDFDFFNSQFRDCAINFAKDRFHSGSLESKRLDQIIEHIALSHVAEFKSAGKTIGYVLAGITERTFHYWFAFYDTDFLQSYPLGKWMMWRMIRWGADHSLSHIYLGTCYTTTALYKVRDHNAIEFFDGEKWSDDVLELKSRCHADERETPATKDLLKLQIPSSMEAP